MPIGVVSAAYFPPVDEFAGHDPGGHVVARRGLTGPVAVADPGTVERHDSPRRDRVGVRRCIAAAGRGRRGRRPGRLVTPLSKAGRPARIKT